MRCDIVIRNVIATMFIPLIAAVVFLGSLSTESADAARTNPEKTYWHAIGNDRFRAYDAGGEKSYVTITIPTLPIPKIFSVPWDASPLTDADLPNPSPYKSHWGNGWQAIKGVLHASNILYSRHVDWPVTMIFRNDASIDRVKAGFENQNLDHTGSRMFLSMSDSPVAGEGQHLWDQDSGLKDAKCSNKYIGPNATNHIRLYADSNGLGAKNHNDKMYNPYWGFYVLGTTHLDYLECPHSEATRFGWSEKAQWRIFWLAHWQWYKWNRAPVSGPSYDADGFHYAFYDMHNKEVPRRNADSHKWESDGRAIVIKVGGMPPKATSAGNPDIDDPEPEEPEEILPEPAIDGDVDGDDKADLVTLDTSGTAYTYLGSNGSSHTTSFGGGMNSALFDGVEHHVIDVADVDADGHSDLITLSMNSALGINNVICVFPGKADGTFGAGILARGGMNPGTFGPSGHEPIGVADVNGDGRGDLVTFYAPQGNIYFYPGLANGQFGDGVTIGGGGMNSALFDREGYYFLDAADVSGDGRADLVGLGSTLNPSVQDKAFVFRGGSTGVGQWPGQINPTVDPIMTDGVAGHEPIGLGDVNGDGKADLVTLNPSGKVSVYAGMNTLNEPTQTYQNLSTTAVESLSSLNSSLMDGTGDDFVDVMDKTGDGKADLVKVATDGTVSVAPGQASLTFGSFTTWVTGVKSNRFNAPSSRELVQEKPFLRRIGCAPAGCSGRPQPPEADVDGDRRSDLVTVDNTGTTHTYGAIGASNHTVSGVGAMDSALYDGTGHYLIDVADVNGDYRADKVSLSNGTVYVYFGKPDGSFAAGIGSFSGAMTPGPRDPNGFEPIAVADVTGDGKGDLVVFHQGEGLKVYPGSVSGTFGSPTVSQSLANSALLDGVGYYFLDVADVTGDRLADLVTLSPYYEIKVFSGSTSGQFTLTDISNLEWSFTSSAWNYPIGLGDVNGDLRADLVMLVNGEVHVYEGRSDGDFWTLLAPKGESLDGVLDSNLGDGVGDEIVGLLDQNGDRRADIVTVRSDGTSRVYTGKEDFTFTSTPQVRSLPGFTPGRFRKIPGHEIISEKPFFFRAGCSTAGCSWPVIDTQSDVGGDERADLVSIESSTQAARIYAGGTQEGFGSSGSISEEGDIDPALLDGKGQYAIDVASVDGDRQGDLVTVRDDGEVLVYQGRGNHTFDSSVDSELSIPPVMNGAGQNEPIGVDDVNADGFDDLVVFVGPGAGKLATYTGRADGRFESEPLYTTYSQSFTSALLDGTGYYFLDVADVTGDGYADVVAVTKWGALVTFKGQANGKFAETSVSTSVEIANPVMDDGSGYEPVGVGDTDGDGIADVAVMSEAGNITRYKGQPDGKFVASGQSNLGINSNLIDGTGEEVIGLLDWDRNGRADLVTLTTSGDRRIYAAKADGTFAAATTKTDNETSVRHQSSGLEFVAEKPMVKRPGCTSSGCYLSTVPPTPSDVDGDHRADLVTLHNSGALSVYSGTGEGIGYYTTRTTTPSLSVDPALRDGVGHYAIAVADVNGDRRADLTTVTNAGAVYVYLGQSNRTFAAGLSTGVNIPPVMSGAGGYEPITVADVNGDGRGDLVSFKTPGQLVSYPGLTNGKFSTTPLISLSGLDSALTDKSGSYFLDAADVTGDRLADVVAMTNTGSLLLYKGQTDGKFAAATTTTGFTVNPMMDDGSGNEPVGLADVTGDRFADLVMLESSGSLKLYKGQTDGKFAAAANALTGTATIDSNLTDESGQELGGLLDYTGDGLADFVTVGSDSLSKPSDKISDYLAQGNGTFVKEGSAQGPIRSTRFKAIGQQLLSEMPARRRGGCAAAGCAWPAPAPTRSFSTNPSFPSGDYNKAHWRAVSASGVTDPLAPALWQMLSTSTQLKKPAVTPPYTPPNSSMETVLDCYTETYSWLYTGSFLDAKFSAFKDLDPNSGYPCPVTTVFGEPWMDEVCVYKPSESEPGTYWFRQDFKVRMASPYGGPGAPYGDITGQSYAKGMKTGVAVKALGAGDEVNSWRFEDATIGAGPWRQTATYLINGTMKLSFDKTTPCGWPELQ